MIDDRTKQIGHRIVRASAAVVVAHVLFKLIGLIQLKVMGHYLSPRVIDTVYVAAFEGCLFSLFLIGEEMIGPAFLPVFMREKTRGGEEQAWTFANVVLSFQFVILLVVTLLVMCFPGSVIRLLTAWDDSTSPDKFVLAETSLVFMAPALICLSLGSTTYMLLNGYKRFFLAALGDASWKLVVLLSVLMGVAMFGMDFRALVAGLVIGSVAKLCTHLAGLTREIRRCRLRFGPFSPALKALLLLMLPLLFGIAFAKVRDVYNNVWVLSTLRADGLMQANSYGRKLYLAIGWLIPYALSIAMFPFFCELVDRDDKKQFAEVLSQSGRMLLSVFVPFSLVCVVLAKPLAYFLFHGGEFGDQSVTWTAISLACYTLVLPAAALEYLLMQAFFAKRKMISVTVVGAVFSTLSMAVSGVAILVYGARGATALAAVALGFALSRTLKSTALVLLLKKDIDFFPFGDTVRFLMRVVLTGLVATGLAYGGVRVSAVLPLAAGRIGSLVELAGGGAGAAIGFLLCVKLLRIEEPSTMLNWALQRIRQRRHGAGQNT